MTYHWPHFSVLTPQDLFDGSDLCILEASQESQETDPSYSGYLSAIPISGLTFYFFVLFANSVTLLKILQEAIKWKKNWFNLLMWKQHFSASLPPISKKLSLKQDVCRHYLSLTFTLSPKCSWNFIPAKAGFKLFVWISCQISACSIRRDVAVLIPSYCCSKSFLLGCLMGVPHRKPPSLFFCSTTLKHLLIKDTPGLLMEFHRELPA